MTPPSATPSTDRRWGWLAAGSLLLVASAVALEIVAGSLANSAVPAWAEWAVPLAWPRAGRVVWWSLVAGAALLFRYSLSRLGLHPRRSVTIALVLPFAVFAVGVALGAEWFTFH